MRDLTSPENFETLVREHQGMVFRTLTRMTGAGAHVEDLAQETFLRLYRALPEFRGDASVSTYLYRIVVNLAQDEWKRRRKDREYIRHVPEAFAEEDEADAWLENMPGAEWDEHARTPEQLFSDAEVKLAVDEAVLQLPEHELEVVVLYHQEECSYEAISTALSMPLNTIRTHLHRGRKRLSALVRTQLSRSERPIHYSVQAGAR